MLIQRPTKQKPDTAAILGLLLGWLMFAYIVLSWANTK